MMAKDKNRSSIWKWEYGLILIVLLLIFYLGLSFIGTPGGGSPVNTQCHSEYAYQCTNVTYYHTTGNATLTLGQKTGANWTSVTVFYVPQGVSTVNGTPATIANGEPGDIIPNGLKNNETTSVTLSISSPKSTAIGTLSAGSIWVKYSTSSGGTYYAQVASIILKAI